MKKQIVSDRSDGTTSAEERPGLVASAAGLAVDAMGAARARLNSALREGEELSAGLRESAAIRAQSADRAIREHPYRTIAIAAGIGALVGFLLAQGRKPGE